MKSKIQIKSIFGTLLFEFECDDNTIKKTVVEANLCDANLCDANLRGANLCDANLYGADLYGADLRDANLRGAKTTKRYIQISCIGSRKGITTYCFEDDNILCGCWSGTLTQFKKQVEETHKNNPQYLAEYLGFINYLEGLKK